jgi:hypothetical protein
LHQVLRAMTLVSDRTGRSVAVNVETIGNVRALTGSRIKRIGHGSAQIELLIRVICGQMLTLPLPQPSLISRDLLARTYLLSLCSTSPRFFVRSRSKQGTANSIGFQIQFHEAENLFRSAGILGGF